MHRAIGKRQGMIMKIVTTKELISLAGIVIATPVLTLAVLVSARAAAVAESDILLLALALCGAAVGGINGFGRRTAKVDSTECRAGSNRQTLPSHS